PRTKQQVKEIALAGAGLDEAETKQFPTPTKPFWRFDANNRKPLAASDPVNDAPNWCARALKQGTTDVQSGCIEAEFPPCRRLRRAGDRHDRIFRLRRGRAAAAVSLNHDSADAMGAAVGTVPNVSQG